MNEQFENKNNEQKNIEVKKIYNKNDAEKIRQEKIELIKNLYSRFREYNLFLKLYETVPCIAKMFFNSSIDKDQHIFYHSLGGSSIGKDEDYYYDEEDKKAESFVKELLEIKDKNEFIKRCEGVISRDEKETKIK